MRVNSLCFLGTLIFASVMYHRYRIARKSSHDGDGLESSAVDEGKYPLSVNETELEQEFNEQVKYELGGEERLELVGTFLFLSFSSWH